MLVPNASLRQGVSRGMNAPLRILRPYAALHKADVIRRGRDLPLELTFTCITPAGERPCGTCIKCGERQRGFRDANVTDPTDYFTTRRPCTA